MGRCRARRSWCGAHARRGSSAEACFSKYGFLKYQCAFLASLHEQGAAAVCAVKKLQPLLRCLCLPPVVSTLHPLSKIMNVFNGAYGSLSWGLVCCKYSSFVFCCCSPDKHNSMPMSVQLVPHMSGVPPALHAMPAVASAPYIQTYMLHPKHQTGTLCSNSSSCCLAMCW